MQLNDTEIMANNFCDMIGQEYGEKAGDFCILDVIDDPNYRSFSIEFTAYNYFPMRINYDKGRFGCCIIIGERGISLESSQKWWDKADFNVFFRELQEQIELRIPDKFLIANGWK